MILKGKYNEAVVFTENLEEGSKNQIVDLLNEEFTKGSKIRIMPDVHVGAGSVIGTTMTIIDKAVPNLVGVDIGCGLIVLKLEDKHIDFHELDNNIKRLIPSGFKVRNKPHPMAEKTKIDDLRCRASVDIERGYKSIGTLGGGNHFIEVNEDEEGNKYLVIHSGSRNIGYQTAKYYQDLAFETLKRRGLNINRNLAYLEGDNLDDYLHDMQIIQEYAYINRKTMADVIVRAMDFKVIEEFQTIHNYIDMERMILRKGAVSAEKDEKFIIPLNMRDGSILLRGKGNENWNFSAPHGAGRVMSRTEARKKINLKDFRKTMKDVHSSSVSRKTIDEAPMAYKKPEDILDYIDETAEVLSMIKPLYNFKAD